MSTVPYIFADDYGNIPLSYLDANFANVKANVDYANAAGSATTALTATTAATVTANAQPNITSVGTLASLAVTGNVSGGNISVGNIASSGNMTVGNITSSGNVTITGTLTAGNIKYTSNVFVGDLKGSVYADDSTIIVDAIDNSISADTASFGTVSVVGNLSTGGNATVTGNLSANVVTVGNVFLNNGVEISRPNWVLITANALTSNLSTTTSYNFLAANNTGYTHTINMPVNPVDGQITRFAMSGNTMTLVEGTGNFNVGFAGTADAGNAYTYVYNSFSSRWIKSS